MSYHLFSTVDFGLSNRLRGYIGAWAYAKKSGATLHVRWTESPACPYRIEELFEPIPGTHFITSDICNNTVYSHTTIDHGHLSHILHGHGLLPTIAPLLIASLTPTESIRKTLRNLLQSYPIQEAIGFHIRRTDHSEYASDLGGATPLETFYSIADSQPTQPIFLACDDPSTLALFKSKYGDRILTAKPIESFSNDPAALRKTDGEHAVLDLYCLAFCKQFQGSNASSFSAHVGYLRNAWANSSSFRDKILPREEKVVFTYSLFGSKKKYTEGMVVNAQQLAIRFPKARVQIYIADDVPEDVVTRLSSVPTVRLIPVKRSLGTQNTLNRFAAIDDPDCDVMFSRDADSRIHDRDAACIEDFLASDKLLHIIRDHRCHSVLILAGMFGLRKRGFTKPLQPIIQHWLSVNGNPTQYGCDQIFLAHVIYPAFISRAMIHDANTRFKFREPFEYTPFRVPICDKLFVGQVHDFNEAGEEFLECGID